MLIQKTSKLVAYLCDRNNFTSHYRNAKLLLSSKTTVKHVEYGVTVDEIHTIIPFNQSPWMEPYSLGINDSITNANHEFEI